MVVRRFAFGGLVVAAVVVVVVAWSTMGPSRPRVLPLPSPAPVPKACQSNADCGAQQACMHPGGQCGKDGKPGTCLDRCGMAFGPDPVCGCDGKVYYNWCDAAEHRVDVLADGCEALKKQREEDEKAWAKGKQDFWRAEHQYYARWRPVETHRAYRSGGVCYEVYKWHLPSEPAPVLPLPTGAKVVDACEKTALATCNTQTDAHTSTTAFYYDDARIAAERKACKGGWLATTRPDGKWY